MLPTGKTFSSTGWNILPGTGNTAQLHLDCNRTQVEWEVLLLHAAGEWGVPLHHLVVVAEQLVSCACARALLNSYWSAQLNTPANRKHPCKFTLWRSNFWLSPATLPPFGFIEGHKWFDQLSSQWASKKNRFAFISFGKIQFLPPCIWNLSFMSYYLWQLFTKIVIGHIQSLETKEVFYWLPSK